MEYWIIAAIASFIVGALSGLAWGRKLGSGEREEIEDEASSKGYAAGRLSGLTEVRRVAASVNRILKHLKLQEVREVIPGKDEIVLITDREAKKRKRKAGIRAIEVLRSLEDY